LEKIRIELWIAAPAERCFDAARDLDLHVKSMTHTNERAVGGRTSGLIELGEEVTWRARHLGVTQHFTSKITAFDRPRHFRDEMQRGAFRSFVHDHFFEVDDRQSCLSGQAGLPVVHCTKMIDALEFSAPLGIFGRIAEKLFLRRYLTRLLTDRAKVIREFAELQ